MEKTVKSSNEVIAEIKDKNENFKAHTWKNYLKYNRLNNRMVVTGVLLSACVTIAGFGGFNPVIDIPYLSGYFGVALSSFLALQSHFKFYQNSNAYRTAHVESKLLRDDIYQSNRDEEEAERLFKKWVEMKKRFEQELPGESGFSPDAEDKN